MQLLLIGPWKSLLGCLPHACFCFVFVFVRGRGERKGQATSMGYIRSFLLPRGGRPSLMSAERLWMLLRFSLCISTHDHSRMAGTPVASPRCSRLCKAILGGDSFDSFAGSLGGCSRSWIGSAIATAAALKRPNRLRFHALGEVDG